MSENIGLSRSTHGSTQRPNETHLQETGHRPESCHARTGRPYIKRECLNVWKILWTKAGRVLTSIFRPLPFDAQANVNQLYGDGT